MTNIFSDIDFTPTKDNTRYSDYSYYDILDNSPFNIFNLKTYDKVKDEESAIKEYTPKQLDPIMEITSNKYIPQDKINSILEEQEDGDYYVKKGETTKNTSKDYSNNRDIIYKFFADEYGFTKEQISGILGVLYSESRLQPDIVRKGGTDTGIAQWTGSRKAKAEYLFNKPLKECNLEEQLQFIKWELTHTHQIVDKIKQCSTPKEAADVWLRGFENGGGGDLISEEALNSTYTKYYPNSKNIYKTFLSERSKNAYKIFNELS